jgi:hypothetical protein
MKIEPKIVPVTISHLDRLMARMRREDRLECRRAGVSEEKAVVATLQDSIFRAAVEVDGELVAIFGLSTQAILSDRATVWLFTTEQFPRHARALVRLTRDAIIPALHGKFSVLENYVDASYTGALRFAEVCGFSIAPPAPMFKTQALFNHIERVRDGV